MGNDKVWSALFACATAILMLGILLLRSTAPPTWAMLTFPMIGALLALAASRTSPNRGQIMWLETSTIAAACVVVLVLVVNGLLIDLFVSVSGSSGSERGNRDDVLLAIVLAAGSAMLWWALERRVRRLRLQSEGRAGRAGPARVADELSDVA